MLSLTTFRVLIDRLRSPKQIISRQFNSSKKSNAAISMPSNVLAWLPVLEKTAPIPNLTAEDASSRAPPAYETLFFGPISDLAEAEFDPYNSYNHSECETRVESQPFFDGCNAETILESSCEDSATTIDSTKDVNLGVETAVPIPSLVNEIVEFKVITANRALIESTNATLAIPKAQTVWVEFEPSASTLKTSNSQLSDEPTSSHSDTSLMSQQTLDTNDDNVPLAFIKRKHRLGDAIRGAGSSWSSPSPPPQLICTPYDSSQDRLDEARLTIYSNSDDIERRAYNLLKDLLFDPSEFIGKTRPSALHHLGRSSPLRSTWTSNDINV